MSKINYKWRLNPVWHRMLYSCTLMATVGVKGLIDGPNSYWCSEHQATNATSATDRKRVKRARDVTPVAITLDINHDSQSDVACPSNAQPTAATVQGRTQVSLIYSITRCLSGHWPRVRVCSCCRHPSEVADGITVLSRRCLLV